MPITIFSVFLGIRLLLASLLTHPFYLFSCMKSMYFTVAALSSIVVSALSAADAPPVWSDFDTQGDIVYLLRKSPAQVMRYDFAGAQWLDPISLNDIPTSLAADDSNLYITFDRSVKRYTLDGSGETHIANTAYPVLDVLVDENYLFVSLYQYTSSYNKSDFTLIDTSEDYMGGISGLSLATNQRKIFGRSRGYSPSDINYLEYDADGAFVGNGESPYHGDYPGATRTWIFPDGTKVVDDSGTVYNTGDLTYNNTFGSSVDALAFHGSDVPIVLIGNTLYSFSNTLLETGSYELDVPAPKDIFVNDDRAVVFYEDASLSTKVGVTSVSLAELSAEDPGEPVSPVGLPYEVEDTAIDDDGILYLLNKAHSSLFRWDTVDQKYIDTIALPDACTIIEYSSVQNKLFLYAPPRRIYVIDLNLADPVPTHFVNLPLQINKLLPMGADLLALNNGSWDSQWLYDSSGVLLDSELSCCYDSYHAYDELTNTLYYGSYRVEYLGDGQFGERQSGGGYSFSPIALSPDGTLFVDQGGIIYDASNAEQIDVLSSDVQAAAWNASDNLFTIKKFGYNEPGADTKTVLQKWNTYNVLEKEVVLQGGYVGLHSNGSQIVVVSARDGTPQFDVFTTDLQVAAPTSIEAPALEMDKYSATAVALSWKDVFGERNYVLERQTDDGGWTEIASLEFATIRYTDVTLESGHVYNFRIKAVNGSVESNYSQTVTLDLVGVADERINPTGIYFVADDIVLSEDDVLYLLAKDSHSIFSWNARTCEWGVTIPLDGAPISIAYSSSNDALYTGYSNGKIFSISLAAENPVEILFAAEAEAITAMVGAGEYLVASLPSRRVNVYGPTGSLIDSDSYRYGMHKGVWDSISRRIFHLRDGTSPNDLLYDEIQSDGSLGAEKDSPYHSSDGMRHPVRVDPNGSIVLLGSGRIYQASTLELIDQLPESHVDATWIDGRLHTLQADKLIAWNLDEYTEHGSVAFDETGLRIFGTQSGEIVLVSHNDEQTFFELLDSQLAPVAKAEPSGPEGIRAVYDPTDGFRIAWSDVAGESGYLLERSSDGNAWQDVATTGKNETTAVDSTAQSGKSYYYRATATVGSSSASSSALKLELTTPSPAGAPELTPLSESSILIEWTAVDNAIKYTIQRSLDGATWTSVSGHDGTTTSFEDSYLDRGTEYSYRIVAIGIAGAAEAGPTSSAHTLIDPPATPASITVSSVAALEAMVNWTQAYDARGYKLERSKAGGDWSLVADLPQSAYSYRDSALEPETNYQYRVIAYNSGGESELRTSTSFTTDKLELPIQPIHRAAQLSATEIAISWAPVEHAVSYAVYRRAVGESEWQTIKTLDGRVTRYVDKDVWIGSAFEYSVSASNSLGESDQSDPTEISVRAIEAIVAVDFEKDSDLSKISQGAGFVTSDPSISAGQFLLYSYGYVYLYLNDIDLRYGGIISFDMLVDSVPDNPMDLRYWSADTQIWTTFHTLQIDSESTGSWQTYSIEVPSEAASESSVFAVLKEVSNSYPVSRISFDNLLIHGFIPDAPPAPPVAFTRAKPSGGLAIFWLPSERADGYTIHRSTDGEVWKEIASVDQNATHYIDSDAADSTAYSYRVIATNAGGKSSPIETAAHETTTDVAAAFEAGMQEVIGNSSDYGLHQTQIISHVYFELTRETASLQGNLLTIPWVVFKTEDFVNWTKHVLNATFDLVEEVPEGNRAFKIAPAK